jgi:hypothetical protein
MSDSGLPRDTAPQDEVRTTQGVVFALHLLMKTVASYGGSHPLAHSAATGFCQAVKEAGPPLALQFVGQATFRDRQLIPFDFHGFPLAEQVAKALHRMPAHEIEVLRVPEPSAVLVLGEQLGQAATGRPPSPWTDPDGFRINEIEGARTGVETEAVDPEVFATTHLSLALAHCEELEGGRERTWAWPLGMATVRRVMRSLEVSIPASLRAVELPHGSWTVARRALSSTLLCSALMRTIEVQPATRRAVAHAMLALCTYGYRACGGLDLADSASAALPRLLQRPARARSGVEPHVVRVCALLHLLEKEAPEEAREDGLMPLLHLCYDLERRRSPDGPERALTLVDLLAWAVAESRGQGNEPWVQLLVDAVGTVPPGACVRLADGRLAMVLDPASAEAPHPLVLVDGQVERAKARVRLVCTLDSEGGAS